MSIKKQAVKKDERKVDIMNEKERQLERITKHPIPINNNVIIVDNLEMGFFRVFETVINGPVYVQSLNGENHIIGANLIAEMTINISWKEKSISLKNLRFKNEYESWGDVMIYQLCSFAEFYNLEIINKD